MPCKRFENVYIGWVQIRSSISYKGVGFWNHLKLYKKHRILECATIAIAIQSDKSYLDIHCDTNGYSWKNTAILHCNDKVWLLWALSSHEITTENELHIRIWSYFSTKWDILVRKYLTQSETAINVLWPFERCLNQILLYHFRMKRLLKLLSI